MGVMNITPDSFSDGGKLNSIDAALYQAEKLLEEGADILDIGGESTRPGAQPVSVSEELDRVIPVIESIKRKLDIKLSVDTLKSKVMSEAAKAGVDLLNDVSALSDPDSIDVVKETGLPICLMHMQGEPRTMQSNPQYDNVIDDVTTFLKCVVKCCEKAGISKEKLLIDPGIGFGKTLDHNLSLLSALPEMAKLGFPVLVGVSRKSLIGDVLNRPVDERMPASIALAAQAALNGASIVRVHDVRETYDAVRMVEAVANAKK